MKLKKTLISIAIATLCVAGSATAADKAAADAAIAAAKSAVKSAASVNGEWRDTGKMIKKAEELAASGDFAGAVKKAKAAEFQGTMGKQQAMEQKNSGNPGYLYN